MLDSNNTNSNKNYKKLLNDLLNISSNDSCIYSKINNDKFFDIYKKFGKDFFNQIEKNEFFSIALKETDVDDLIVKLNDAQNGNDIINLFKDYNYTLPKEMHDKLVKENSIDYLKSIKKDIIKNLEIQQQKKAFKWKMLLTQAKDLNEQNNLWPIHLGFVYITCCIDNKIIQAPLFLKEVNIKIQNSKVSLFSVGDIKLNEKLLYFLESNQYIFDLDFDYTKMSINQLYHYIKQSWSLNFELPKSLEGFVPSLERDEIENEKIYFWPGISLGFFEPTGGYLRKVMQHILNNNLLDSILNVEFDKNLYKQKIEDTWKKKNFGFYKIVNSNFSQDQALISALNQNTIIWGPPGTGKSQTISNILTNILMYQKSALVVSQKRAALEVLKNRMKSLEIFCLFILNDKQMKKSTFFEPIIEYINFLENLKQNEQELNLTIISEEEKIIMKKINLIFKNQLINENIKLYFDYSKNNDFSLKIFNDIMKLDPSLNYDLNTLSKLKPNKVGKMLMKINHIKRKNPFISVNSNIKNIANLLNENILNLNFFDLDYFIKQQNLINLNLLKDIDQINLDLTKLKYEKDVNDHHKLKLLIAQQIVNKLKQMPNELKEKYNNFALDARSKNLDPLKFIKKHIEIIKLIYPIIITNPETDIIQCWEQNEFDYVLLDEASQIFLEKGIPILYFGKIKILAGDDQQMQPSRWFSAKVSEEENVFGNIESLLNYAIAKGTYKLLLDKNYRSHFASLMKFNSEVFYEGKLDVIDTNGIKINGDPIEVINVDGVWEDSKNIVELEEVINQINLNINSYSKIIVLCFNASQQNELISIILNGDHPHLEKELENEHLLIRNIENIQGDECDLLIATISYDKNTKLHSTYVAKSGGKNALNVAISRARDKMIVIKSIKGSEIQNPTNSIDIAIFKEWLSFLDLNKEEQNEYKYKLNKAQVENSENENNEQNNKIKNWFLESILNDLKSMIKQIDLNEIILNYPVGTLKIPLAIINKENKKFIKGLYIDVFDYNDSYLNYVKDKDVFNFFKSKNYDVIRVNPLNWNKIKKSLIKEINKINKDVF